MLRTMPPPLTVSPDLYLAILRENPDLRIERSKTGELIFVPPTGSLGSERNMELARQLANWSRRDGTGHVFDSNGGFRLPSGAMRAADAAWVSDLRWRNLNRELQEAFAPLCPDFVAELLSPSDDLSETRERLADYVAEGARLGWLIDPFRRAVEIYRPGREPAIHLDVQTLDGEDVLPGFVLELAPIFERLTRG